MIISIISIIIIIINAKALCSIWDFCREKVYPLGSSAVFCTAPSIDAWSIAEILWQHIN